MHMFKPDIPPKVVLTEVIIAFVILLLLQKLFQNIWDIFL